MADDFRAVYHQLDRITHDLKHMEEVMIDPREFGRLENAVDNLKKEVDDIKAKQTQMDTKLDQVLAKLSEAKGGWRALMLLGGAGATLGAAITWLLTHTIHVGPRG